MAFSRTRNIKTLWPGFSDFPGKKDQPQAPSVLKAFDLQTGTLKSSYQLPTKGAFCNDIAIGEDGTAYISDTNNMEVDRLASGGQQLEVWAGNGGFGPKGGILDGISVLGDRLFVNTLETNKIFSVPIDADGKAGDTATVKLDRAIENPEGMRAFGNNGVLIVKGGGQGPAVAHQVEARNATVVATSSGFPKRFNGIVEMTLFANPSSSSFERPFR